jgi:predicted TIM-barrel fold metal-dependent hydrolase
VSELQLIDAHSHIYPRLYVDLLKARTEIPRVAEHDGREFFVIFEEEQAAGPGGGRPFDRTYTDLDEKVAFMDRNSIARTVVSVGNPWLDPFRGSDSAEIARELNAELATYEVRTSGRVLGMGVLPADSVESAIQVAREVARTPGLYGLVSGRRISGHLLDDEALEPLWAALAEIRLPLLIHPHYAAAADQLKGFGHALPVSVGFPFETTIAVARLVFAGVLHRHADLRLICSHGGGVLPFLAGRVDAGWRSDASVRARLPEPPSSSMARLYLDAVLYHQRALAAAADLVGGDRMVYGSDHPFSIADPDANLAALTAAFEGDDLQAVANVTAERLFGIEPA